MTRAERIAEDLVSWMAKQVYGEEPLLHASVCCDHIGRSCFTKAVAERIHGALPPDKPSRFIDYTCCECGTEITEANIVYGPRRRSHARLVAGGVAASLRRVAHDADRPVAL